MPSSQDRYPSFEEIEGFLREWSRKAGDRAILGVEGRSPNQRPVYSVTLTDPETSAETKQHVVLSCVHSTERSAVAVLFAVMDWLLSSDPLAREVMCRQVIVCMPIVSPDGYVAGRLAPEQRSCEREFYSGWTPTGVEHPDRFPEAVASRLVRP